MNNPSNDTLVMETTTETSKQRLVPRRRGAAVYDGILWRLQPVMDDQHGVAYSLGITSCERRSGTTTLAANLATRAADHGMGPVLLVDTNAARPGATAKYRMKNSKGLADLLSEGCQACDAIYPTKTDGLSVMPIGTRGLMERIGMEPQHLAATLNGLRESFGMILFDLPPASDLHQTLLIARQLDSVLLAVNSGTTTKSNVQKATSQLRADGVKLTGAVLTRHRNYVPSWISKRF